MEKITVKLTERDIELLKLLGRYGVISIKDINEKFFQSSRYYRTRLLKLEKGGYIIRSKRKYVYLGIEGKRYLENINLSIKSINSNENYRRRLADIYKLLSKLTEFEIVTNTEVREENFNVLSTKRYRFYGKVKGRLGEEYWVYRITKIKNHDEVSIKGKRLDISMIKKDIEERTHENANANVNVMIFIDDELTLKLYKEDTTTLKINKEIVLLYNEKNIDFVNNVIAKGIDSRENIISMLKRRKCNVEENKSIAAADFVISKNDNIKQYVFNLSNKDLKKEKAFQSYLDILLNKDLVAIACYNEETQDYKNLYPGIEVIALEKPLTM